SAVPRGWVSQFPKPERNRRAVASSRGKTPWVRNDPGCGPQEREPMRRVVVTGLGVVAPNGVGKDAFWSACVAGRSGVGPIRCFDASEHPVKIAAEVPDFDVTAYVPGEHRKSLKIMGRASRFGVTAAVLAARDSGIAWDRGDP